MNLNGKAYFKIFEVSYNDIKFEKYRRIVDIIWPLIKRRDYEIPECSAFIFVIHLRKYLKRI